MNSESPADDRLRAGALFLTMLAVGGYLWLGPLGAARDATLQLRAQTDQLMAEHHQLAVDTVRDRIDAMHAVLSAAQDDLLVLESQLPAAAELPVLLHEIAEYAQRSALAVQGIAPATPVVDSPLVQRQYTVSVRGSTANIHRFVQALTGLPRAVGVDALQLSTSEGSLTHATLQLRTATALVQGTASNALARDLVAAGMLQPAAYDTLLPASENSGESGGTASTLTASALTLLAIVHAGHATPVRAVIRDSITGQRWTVGVGDALGERLVHAIHATTVVLMRPMAAGMRMDTVRWPVAARSRVGLRTVPALLMPESHASSDRVP
jgi:Tfp pilus assembly protein PilO